MQGWEVVSQQAPPRAAWRCQGRQGVGWGGGGYVSPFLPRRTQPLWRAVPGTVSQDHVSVPAGHLLIIPSPNTVWASTIHPPSASGTEPQCSWKGLRPGLEVSHWRIRTFLVPGLCENPHIQRGQSQFLAPHTDRTEGRQMPGGMLCLHLPWTMLFKGVGISKGQEPRPFVGS